MSRRYSEEDARRIFARVAEQQARRGDAPSGLSLDDLEEAARAAGLDPALVAQAAAELDGGGAAPERLMGAPTEVAVTRVIPGTLTDDVWAALVAEARRQFRGAGTAGQVGRVREWTIVSGGAKNGVTTHLTAEPVAGGIRVTMTQSVRDMVLAFGIVGGFTTLMSLLFVGMAAAGVDPELWVASAITMAMAVLFVGGSQIGSRWWLAQRGRRFETVLDRFELIARDADEPPAIVNAPADARRLDLDALGDAPAEGDVAGASRPRTRS